jgi:hypothetical protein
MHTSTRSAALALILVVCLFLASPSFALYSNYSPVQGNFRHTPEFPGDTPPGLPVSGGRFLRGSVIIADLDPGANNGKEIIAGSSDGTVFAYRQDGTFFWSKKIESCVPDESYGLINTAPAVGNLFGNGKQYVVIGFGTIVKTASCAGTASGNTHAGIVVLDGLSGNINGYFYAPTDFMDGTVKQNAVLSSPTLSDVDGDGRMEIGFASLNNNIYLLNADLTARWRYQAWDTIFGSPAFADVNGDGKKEMIIGTGFGPENDPDTTGKFPGTYGWMYAFNTDPQPDGLLKFGEGYLWAKQFNQTIDSSPAIADLDGDGKLEVVFGSGCDPRAIGNGKWVKVLDAATGGDKATLNAPSCIHSSPALGDLNGDGKLDVVANVAATFASDNKGRVVAWSITNPASPLWSTISLSAIANNDGFAEPHNLSPIIADLDGNGSLEVIVYVADSITVYRGDNSQPLTTTCKPSDPLASCPLKSLYMWYPSSFTPAVADLDNDGKLELVGVASGDSHTTFAGKGVIFAWRDFSTFLDSPDGTQAPYSAPWPMFHGNAQHTGVYPQLIAPTSSSVLIKTGTSRTYPISFVRSDGAAFNWTIAESDSSNVITLNRTSGAASDDLVITFHAPASAGTYKATLTLQADGLSPVSLPVTLIAADNVYSVMLPLTIR